MGELLVLNAPRELGFQTYEDVPLKPDELRIQTLYSGISAGTELTFYRGTNPYLSKHWDAEKRLFTPESDATFAYPVMNLGYEEVGEVIEVGANVTDIPLGTHVFGTWGHRTRHVANLDYVRPRLMPEGAEPIFGISTHFGSIALSGFHNATIRLGDTVAIVGMRALGQMVAMMARRAGGRIRASHLHETRLQRAERLGGQV